MDSVILLGQKNTLAEYMILSGADNRPPMLDKDLDDPITCLNKAMAFLTAITSSRVIVKQVHGRQGQIYSGNGYKSNATSSAGSNASEHAREKAMLAEAQEAGKILDEEQHAFLVDPGVPDGQVVQTIIPNNASLQTKDLDTYDSNCDDISNAQAVLMANISNYGSDVISDVPHSETYLNDMLNRLTEDFGKRFTPQQELLVEQALQLRMSDPTSKPSDALPIKIEAPKELLKISLVIESLKKLKFHLAKFHNVVKIRTTPNACIKGEWGFKHTKDVFNNEIIPFLKSLKEIFNVFDRDLLNEILEIDLKAQLQDKDSTICKLKDMIKSMRENSKDENVKYDYCEIETKNVELEYRKEIVDIAAQIPSTSTIVPGMFKLDLEPLAPRVMQNQDVHIKYLKYAQEQADIRWGIVKQARAKQPLDKELDFACCPDCSLLSGNWERPYYKNYGYGDNQLGNVTISRVYYIEGLGHNLFSVGQFCDGDLEVAF
ncbi:hypothetical protein Tco_1100257 [Tanacetum coccineum]